MYVQDHDEILPTWWYYGGQGYVMWPEFMRAYFREPRILEQGFTTHAQRTDRDWLADYALCAWKTGGSGNAEDPYWRWPGALSADPDAPRPMSLAEVRRLSETLQLADGFTN